MAEPAVEQVKSQTIAAESKSTAVTAVSSSKQRIGVFKRLLNSISGRSPVSKLGNPNAVQINHLRERLATDLTPKYPNRPEDQRLQADAVQKLEEYGATLTPEEIKIKASHMALQEADQIGSGGVTDKRVAEIEAQLKGQIAAPAVETQTPRTPSQIPAQQEEAA